MSPTYAGSTCAADVRCGAYTVQLMLALLLVVRLLRHQFAPDRRAPLAYIVMQLPVQLMLAPLVHGVAECVRPYR